MRRRRSRRAIALILALFTTAILMILSVSFLALALTESRTSQTAGYEGAATQAANFALGYAINYMGRGGLLPGSTTPVWGRQTNPDGIGFYNVLNPTNSLSVIHPPGSTLADGYPIKVTAVGTTPGRVLSIESAGQPYAIDLGPSLFFTARIEITPVLNARGIPSYRLVATAEVYRKNGGGNPVARRTVEARVLEESTASYLHFLSNGRSNNVQGQPTGEINNPQTQALADYARIPRDYVENGPIRIDGQSTSGANASNVFAPKSGNLRFAANTSSNTTKFLDTVMINKNANVYDDGNKNDSNAGFFKKGFIAGQPSLGLPSFSDAKTTLRQAANTATQSGKVKGLIDVSSQYIMGNTTLQPQYLGKQSGVGGNPFVERIENRTVTLPDGSQQTVQVPIQFDYRPRYPNVEISINNDDVTITNVSTLTGATIGSPMSKKVSAFEKGVIYVEGGNAVIKQANNVTGQLTVATAEDPDRENGSYNTTNPGSEAIYAEAARQAYELEKYRAEQIRNGADRDTQYSALKVPPYTASDLQSLKTQFPGNITASIPNTGTSRKFFPPPGTPNTPKVEREGNLGIAADINYNPADRSTVLGLIAQNFVLLNDNTPDDKTINIDGVLMSGERSVQFDWDNTLRQNTTTWNTQMQENYNGNISLKGSIVGEYTDVEGDVKGRGFPIQNFEHDRQLNFQRPPYFPKWDFSSLPGGFQFVMTHYVDRGAISTEGSF